uniref:HDC03425 n=1 Tax=Drosophila melanogaster TaxID=7227 RepID=Q6IH39_DROME|nr:TPA_inf: HDC03425 [Drosophila melanogaster]
MLDGIRLVTTAATTPTTTLQSQEVINTIPAPATATTRPTIPLTLVLVSVSASAAMCRPPLCKCRLSSGQTAHCNLHLNDPASEELCITTLLSPLSRQMSCGTRNLSRRLIFPGAEDAEEVPCHFHNVDKGNSMRKVSQGNADDSGSGLSGLSAQNAISPTAKLHLLLSPGSFAKALTRIWMDVAIAGIICQAHF